MCEFMVAAVANIVALFFICSFMYFIVGEIMSIIFVLVFMYGKMFDDSVPHAIIIRSTFLFSKKFIRF